MINKAKGFNVLVDQEVWKKTLLINKLNSLAQSYGFTFLETPTIEKKSIYEKSIGLVSDIVQKEFFVTHSLSGLCSANLVLRPEFTSAVVSYFFNQKLYLQKKPAVFFSQGDCYRYEKPQKGRYRQFSQWNLEVIGSTNLDQYFSFLATFLNSFHLKKKVIIETNYLSYQHFQKIKAFLEKIKSSIKFCLLCQKRWKLMNFYRILDCNNCQPFLQSSWKKTFFWTSQDATNYFQILQKMQLFFSNFVIKENPFLTRGLDYYQGFVFEIKLPDANQTQSTVIAGGNYQLNNFLLDINQGKTSTKETLQTFLQTKNGFGFAIGIERFLLLLNKTTQNLSFLFPQIVIAYTLPSLQTDAYLLQQEILSHYAFSASSSTATKINCWVNYQDQSFSEILTTTLNYLPKSSSSSGFHFWLVVLEKKYSIHGQYLCRKITNHHKTDKPFQFYVKKAEIINFFLQKISL